VNGFKFKERLNPMRRRQSKISSQVQQNTLGFIATTTTLSTLLQLKGITLIIGVQTFHNASNI